MTCAAAALLLCAPASARATGDPLGFGIEAVGHPSYFVFDASTGETVGGALRITSTSDRARTVFLRPAGAKTAATGGLDYGDQGVRPAGAARWLRLERRQLSLPAWGVVEVPFSARIPRGARAGDHLAGIVAFGRPPRAERAGNSRFRLRFVSRLAIAVQFRVPGRLTRGLELRDTEIQVAPAGATLGLRLASTGNALISETTGSVSVFQEDRELFTRQVRIDAFVPSTEITYPVAWQTRPVEGEYRIHGTLRPEGASPIGIDETVEFGQERIKEFREETGRQAGEMGGTSAAVLGLTALLAAVLAGVALGRRRSNTKATVTPLEDLVGQPRRL